MPFFYLIMQLCFGNGNDEQSSLRCVAVVMFSSSAVMIKILHQLKGYKS